MIRFLIDKYINVIITSLILIFISSGNSISAEFEKNGKKNVSALNVQRQFSVLKHCSEKNIEFHAEVLCLMNEHKYSELLDYIKSNSLTPSGIEINILKGIIYSEGDGIKKDVNKAISFLEENASLDYNERINSGWLGKSKDNEQLWLLEADLVKLSKLMLYSLSQEGVIQPHLIEIFKNKMDQISEILYFKYHVAKKNRNRVEEAKKVIDSKVSYLNWSLIILVVGMIVLLWIVEEKLKIFTRNKFLLVLAGISLLGIILMECVPENIPMNGMKWPIVLAFLLNFLVSIFVVKIAIRIKELKHHESLKQLKYKNDNLFLSLSYLGFTLCFYFSFLDHSRLLFENAAIEKIWDGFYHSLEIALTALNFSIIAGIIVKDSEG